MSELADCAKAALERDGEVALSYGSTLGYGPLREWLAERHSVEPARVLVTNGSLQAFHFVLDSFSGRGRVLVERPTYDRPRKILAAAGLELGEIGVDDDGLDVDELERELDGPAASFLYTIPTFQNPTGSTLSADRRRRLAELVCRARAAGARGRPVRPRSLRGRAAPVGLRARGRRARHVLVVVLEDDRARAARRLRDRLGRARREARGARRLDLHHAGAARAGHGLRVPAPRPVRAQPRARLRAAARRDATRCSGLSSASCPAGLAGTGPRAATSSGSTFPRSSTPPSCSPARARRA